MLFLSLFWISFFPVGLTCNLVAPLASALFLSHLFCACVLVVFFSPELSPSVSWFLSWAHWLDNISWMWRGFSCIQWPWPDFISNPCSDPAPPQAESACLLSLQLLPAQEPFQSKFSNCWYFCTLVIPLRPTVITIPESNRTVLFYRLSTVLKTEWSE